MRFSQFLAVVTLAIMTIAAIAQNRTATLALDFTKNLGPMQMDHILSAREACLRTRCGITASPRSVRFIPI